MTLEEDIDSFRIWATKLGCPPDAIPHEEALKSVFKSRQRDLFRNLMKRVQPRQDVREIHENILIMQMEKLNDQVVQACGRSFLPKEMQIFLKVKDLKKEKEHLELRLEEAKKQYDLLAGSIKTKNIQSINLEQKDEVAADRVTLLQFKSESLERAIKKEQHIKEQIIATMPVKLSEKNASEAVAMTAVETALHELEIFYNLYYSNNNNVHLLQEAKDDLWKKMRTTFVNIPNFLLFSAIMRLKDEQLQNIIALNKSNLEESHTRALSSHAFAKEPLSSFELKLMKTKADLLGLVAKYLAARHDRVQLEERFSNAYGSFVDELQKKVNLLNAETEEHTDEIISDYIVQYNLRNFSKSQNEFLAQQIEFYKADIESGAKQLENHEVLLGSIRQVYSDINASINRVQYEMLQLSQIKEKILYSKNMLKLMLDDMHSASNTTTVKSNFLTTKMKMNPNISLISTGVGGGGGGVGGNGIGGDSFEYGADSVLCSTKLDFDSTMASLNNTTLRRSFGAGDSKVISGMATLPPHAMELSIFNETPLEKFHCMSRECAFRLSRNPLIVESSELSSTIQLAPGTLLTPYGAWQEVRNRIVWANLIAEHSNDLKLDLELVLVNPYVFKQKSKRQREHVVELLDKIDVTAINTQHVLQKVSKLYDFVLANPLRHFIPATKCFNEQTYADYEAEYTTYHRMASVGSSIK